MSKLWTLITPSRAIASGIFLSKIDAEMWAITYLPELDLEPIELLLSDYLRSEVTDILIFTSKGDLAITPPDAKRLN